MVHYNRPRPSDSVFPSNLTLHNVNLFWRRTVSLLSGVGASCRHTPPHPVPQAVVAISQNRHFKHLYLFRRTETGFPLLYLQRFLPLTSGQLIINVCPLETTDGARQATKISGAQSASHPVFSGEHISGGKLAEAQSWSLTFH